MLIAIANSCGLQGDELISMTAEQAIKDHLRTNTEEAIARGAYGSPTLFVGDALYFGNDQVSLVKQALANQQVKG